MGYFIRKRKNGWALLKTRYEGSKCIGTMIPEADLSHHLFNCSMTLEEAKEQAKKLNKDTHNDIWLKKRISIQERLKKEVREKSVFLPEKLTRTFEQELSTLPDARRMKTVWMAATRAIKALQIPPEDWKRRRQTVYNYFEEKHLSPDYAKKIIRLMNMWGEFQAMKTSTPYSHLMCPTGFAAGRMLRTYKANRKKDKASDGLTPELLKAIRQNLPLEQFNFLFISLWFGLRPQEVRNLNRGPEFSYFDHNNEENVDVLNVLQTKLVNLSEEDQWKGIPILHPEQREAAMMVQKGIFEEPLPKTIKRYTLGNHHLYAGRKGFGPLMWGLGHDVVEVSSWLGHKSIDRTYRDYMKWKRLKIRSKPHLAFYEKRA